MWAGGDSTTAGGLQCVSTVGKMSAETQAPRIARGSVAEMSATDFPTSTWWFRLLTTQENRAVSPPVESRQASGARRVVAGLPDLLESWPGPLPRTNQWIEAVSSRTQPTSRDPGGFEQDSTDQQVQTATPSGTEAVSSRTQPPQDPTFEQVSCRAWPGIGAGTHVRAGVPPKPPSLQGCP